MTRYYAQRLAAERLAHCYELAPPRMRRYLEQEIVHLLERIAPGSEVLELGCGYGRVALRLAAAGALVTGIDVAEDSLAMARELAASTQLESRCRWQAMDALALDFDDASFDAVLCVQNGIAAFRVDREALVREAWRVLRPGGLLLLATYTEAIWPDRLAWFEAQAEAGLIGAIDHQASREGVIVCNDGFRSGRASDSEFHALAFTLSVDPVIEEVDASSLWCELRKPAPFVPPTGAPGVAMSTRRP